MDIPSKATFSWSWDDEYETFSFDGRKISIPRYVKDELEKIAIPEQKRLELANSFIGLREAVKESFGFKEVSIYGPLAGTPRPDNTSGFFLHSSNKSIMLLEYAMIDLGNRIDKYNARMETRGVLARLFTVGSATGNVFNFSTNPSSLSVAAEKVGGKVFEKFNKSVESNSEEHFVSVEDMLLILSEMKKQTVIEFESSELEFTDKNMKNYLNLLNLKDFETFKDAIERMPYLQVYEKVEQNILNMVNIGLTYERMYAMSILEAYPKDEEELKTFLSLPYKWMVKAFIG
jgi:hypothetical protein